jgi:hypothetical protein
MVRKMSLEVFRHMQMVFFKERAHLSDYLEGGFKISNTND